LKGHKLKTSDDIVNSVVQFDAINKSIEDHVPIEFDENSINDLNIEHHIEKKVEEKSNVISKSNLQNVGEVDNVKNKQLKVDISN